MWRRFDWRTLSAVATLIFIVVYILLMTQASRTPTDHYGWADDGGLMTQASRAPTNRYGWADNEGLLWTAAVVEGRSEAEVIRGYGGDPDHPVGAMPFAATEPDLYRPVPLDLPANLIPAPIDEGKVYVQILTHGRYVVALENNGFAGADPTLARRLSQSGGRFSASIGT
jgi:hypothetical protein